MSYELEGTTVATNANGYLENHADWSTALAEIIAAEENVELTEKHWDIMNYLRDEYLHNGANQPNERTILKAMKTVWGKKPTSKQMYQLFPGTPSKQAAKIAGLPETRRKGGY